MFQTIQFSQPICRMPQQPRPRPEHYANVPVSNNRPCIIQPKNDDDEGDGTYEAGSRAVYSCNEEETEPTLFIEWDNTGRIVSSGNQSTRAGCGSSGGSS
jgi:hypothetical protein